MTVVVEYGAGSHRLIGSWPGVAVANAFLAHLQTRRFSPATVRAYAFDVVCLARFLEERRIALGAVVPTDIFDWVDWQSRGGRRGGGTVVPMHAGRGAGGWCARNAGCPSRWTRLTCRCSWPTSGHTGTGPSCWRWCSVACVPVRSDGWR